jgi:hypothetical protein
MVKENFCLLLKVSKSWSDEDFFNNSSNLNLNRSIWLSFRGGGINTSYYYSFPSHFHCWLFYSWIPSLFVQNNLINVFVNRWMEHFKKCTVWKVWPVQMLFPNDPIVFNFIFDFLKIFSGELWCRLLVNRILWVHQNKRGHSKMNLHELNVPLFITKFWEFETFWIIVLPFVVNGKLVSLMKYIP